MPVRSKRHSVAARSPAFTSDAQRSEQIAGLERCDLLTVEINELGSLDLSQLRLRWRNNLGGTFPAHLPKWLLVRVLAYRLQVAAFGGLDAETIRTIRGSSPGAATKAVARFSARSPQTKDGSSLRPGALLVREWQGELHRVMVVSDGFAWKGETYSSLSKIASAITGARWNGHRFFELRQAKPDKIRGAVDAQ